jgi:hypothetical protein
MDSSSVVSGQQLGYTFPGMNETDRLTRIDAV